MSDHDAAPDPTDKAYAQAEALLDDESARAARRARVLAAVASDPAPPAVSTHDTRRPAWRPGGWLAAASVAGLSALVGVQAYQPGPVHQKPAPTAPAAPAAAAPAPAAPGVVTLPRAASAPAPAPKSAAPTPTAAPRAKTTPAHDVPPAVASPAPPASEAPPPAAAQRSDSVSEVVVTSQRRASAPAPPAGIETTDRSPPAIQAARLRDAAAAGRISEMTALLARGAPVDAPDEEGETALMKAVQANHPAAAVLLRRHGASLDLKNYAGDSARDMAAVIGDAELNGALGLGP